MIRVHYSSGSGARINVYSGKKFLTNIGPEETSLPLVLEGREVTGKTELGVLVFKANLTCNKNRTLVYQPGILNVYNDRNVTPKPGMSSVRQILTTGVIPYQEFPSGVRMISPSMTSVDLISEGIYTIFGNVAVLYNNPPLHEQDYCFSLYSGRWYVIAQLGTSANSYIFYENTKGKFEQSFSNNASSVTSQFEWIVHKTDYRTSLNGVPNRQQMVILSRKKMITRCVYNEYIRKAKELGYNISNLQGPATVQGQAMMQGQAM